MLGLFAHKRARYLGQPNSVALLKNVMLSEPVPNSKLEIDNHIGIEF